MIQVSFLSYSCKIACIDCWSLPSHLLPNTDLEKLLSGQRVGWIYLRNRSAPAVNCWVIIHCLEVSCEEDQITSAQRKWFILVQLSEKQWIITQQFTHLSWSISILTHNKRRKHLQSLQHLPTFRHCIEELPPILRLRRIRLHVIVTSFKRKTTLHRLTQWMTSFSSDVSYHTLLRWIIVRYITVCYRWLYRRDVLELTLS